MVRTVGILTRCKIVCKWWPGSNLYNLHRIDWTLYGLYCTLSSFSTVYSKQKNKQTSLAVSCSD